MTIKEWFTQKKNQWAQHRAADRYIGDELIKRKADARATTSEEARQPINNDINAMKGALKEQRRTNFKQFTGMPHPLEWFKKVPTVPSIALRMLQRGMQRGGAALERGRTSTIASFVTRTKWSVWIFLLLTVFYHLTIIYTQPNLQIRILLNILLPFISFLALFDASERNRQTARTLTGIALFEILYPIALMYIPGIQNYDLVKMYIGTGILPLTWFYYALFVRGDALESRWFSLFKFIIVIFWFMVLFSYITLWSTPLSDVELSTIGTDASYAMKQITARAKEGIAQAGSVVWSGLKGIWNIYDVQQKQLSSEYYTGVVDENEKQKLGVYIDNVKAAKPQFFRDERVNVFATLETKTLEDTINVEVACYVGEKKKEGKKQTQPIISGEVYPGTSFSVADFQGEEIDCKFAEGELESGTRKVTVAATYNFETIGYIKRFFMDSDALNAAKRQGIDPLVEYKIQDRQPLARFTNGPVKIGIGPEEEIIGVSELSPIKPRLGITLDNNQGWQGHMKKVRQMIILMPSATSLDIESCTDPNFREFTIEDCVDNHNLYQTLQSKDCRGEQSCLSTVCEQELGGMQAYTLDTSINPKLYEDLESFITISCRLNIDDIQKLLGNTPLATHTFYVKARYDYETEKQGTVTIKEETVSGIIPTKKKKYGSDEELLKEIYLEQYYQTGIIQKAISEQFPSLDPYLVMGIIAAKAKNDPNYVGRRNDGIEERGLMHLQLIQVAQAKQLLGLTTAELFDPEQNIMMGVRVLSYLDALPSTATLEDVLAAYYSGETAVEKTESGTPRWQADPTLIETRLYVDLVKAYAAKAKDLELITQGEIKETQNTSPESYTLSGTIDLSQLQQTQSTQSTPSTPSTPSPQVTTTATVDDISLEFMITKNPSTHRVDITATIDNKEYGVGTFIFMGQEQIGTWMQLGRLPFIQLKLDPTLKKLEYRILRSSTIITPTLVEGSTTYTLWKDFIQASYDGNELHLLFDRGDRLIPFCEINWPRNVITQQCDEPEVRGITARRIERTEGIENSLGTGFTKAQMEYDLKEQLKGIGK